MERDGFTPADAARVDGKYWTENDGRFAHLDHALREASLTCHASADRTAVIYYTTDPEVADPDSGELYIVFRGDQAARHYLKDNWRACYSVKAEGQIG